MTVVTRLYSRTSGRSRSRLTVAGSALVVQALLVVSLLVDSPSVFVSVVRFVLAFLALSFVPGMLLLGAVGVDLDRSESVLYAIVASLGLSMLLGFAVNVVYLEGFLPAMLGSAFSLRTAAVASTVLIVGLTVLFLGTGRAPLLPTLDWRRVTRLHLLAMAVLGNAVLGAVFINWYGTNLVALTAIVLIALLTTVLSFSDLDGRTPAVVWLVALSLLSLSSLIDDYLFQGDGVWEYYHSRLVLVHGFWDPAFQSTYNSPLRLVALHPLYSLLTGIDLYWEYKLVHPVLFSLLGLALYLLYSRHFTKRVALTATLLYVFSYPFFTRLARDTRSATALFAMATFLLVVSDEGLTRARIAVFGTLALFVLTVSHYGIAILFLVLLLVATVTYYGYSKLDEIRLRFLDAESVPPRPAVDTLAGSMLILATLYVLWYSYAANGVVLDIIYRTTYNGIYRQLGKLLSSSSNAGHSVALEPVSYTYQFVKYQYIAIVLLAGLGLAVAAVASVPLPARVQSRLGSLPERLSPRRERYLALGVGGGVVIAGAIAPTRTMGIKRVFMISMVVLMPYAAWLAVSGLDVLRQYRRIVVAALLVVVLLVNSGFVAAVIQERSTQPNIDRPDTMAEGTQWEVYHLLHRYRTPEEIEASSWLVQYQGSCMVSGSRDVSQEPVTYLDYTGYDTERPPGIDYNKFDLTPSNGYLYLGTFSQRYEAVYRQAGFNRTDENLATYEELNVSSMNRIFDNTRSAVMLNGTCGAR